MKKIYIPIFGILLTIGLAAQPASQSLKVRNGRTITKHQPFFKIFSERNNGLKSNQMPNPMILLQGQPTLKSAVVKQKLDSLVSQSYDTINFVWKPNDTGAFTYDSKGKNTSYISYSWNSPTNRKEPQNKTEYNYNPGGYLTAYHSFDWDTIATVVQWVETYKTLYSYNANNWVSQNLVYVYDTDSAKLVASSKTQFTYDTQGNILTQISSSWNTELNDWEQSSKTVNTFDSKNNMLTSEYSINMGGVTWMVYSSYMYSYDSQNRLLEEVDYRLDYMTQHLIYSSKDVYTYNSGGDNILTISSKWQANAWVNDWRDEYTYDSNHRLLTYKEFDWDLVSGSWKPYWSEEITYDTNGNAILAIYNDGDGAGGWVKDSKMEITYNNSYNSSDLLFPYMYGINFSNSFGKMVTNFTDYQWKNGQWRYDTKTTFYYSPINITSADIIGGTTFMVYPNPAKDYLNVYSDSDLPHEVSLFNLVGNMVLQKQFNNQIILSVGNLPSGIYLIRIKSSDNPKDFIQRIVVK
jgi:hypothetical protein